MANINVANIKAPKAPNLPIAPNDYSQEYFNILTNVLRLYFNQMDILFKYMVNPDIGYYLNTGYGGFSSSATQTVSAANTPTAITFNTTDIYDSNKSLLAGQPDIYIDPTADSHIVILIPAIYNFQFSLQLSSTNATHKVVWVWPRIDGVDVVNSATKITMDGSGNYTVASWNFLLETLTPGSYFELIWAADNTNIALEASAAATSPFAVPAIPSVILTVSSVSA